MHYSNARGKFIVEKFRDAPDKDGHRALLYGYEGTVGNKSFRGVAPSQAAAVETCWEILSFGSAERREAERLRITSVPTEYEHPDDIRKALVVTPVVDKGVNVVVEQPVPLPVPPQRTVPVRRLGGANVAMLAAILALSMPSPHAELVR